VTRCYPCNLLRCVAIAAALAFGAIGCATTGAGGAGGIPQIPEGKGRLVLETGGISEVNFYVNDQETDEEVYAATPRLGASSPMGYERGGTDRPPMVDLLPGTYTVVVTTDTRDPVQIPDVEIQAGVDRYVQVPVGRFQILYSAESGRAQVPFLIYDYGMKTVLGKGLTSTEVRYFIAPVGDYKIRIENASSGIDEIRPVQVSFGRPQNITIGPAPVEEVPAGTGQTDKE
jgi:hypothetical protein